MAGTGICTTSRSFSAADGAAAIDLINRYVTPAQIGQAEKLAREWRPDLTRPTDEQSEPHYRPFLESCGPQIVVSFQLGAVDRALSQRTGPRAAMLVKTLIADEMSPVTGATTLRFFLLSANIAHACRHGCTPCLRGKWRTPTLVSAPEFFRPNAKNGTGGDHALQLSAARR